MALADGIILEDETRKGVERRCNLERIQEEYHNLEDLHHLNFCLAVVCSRATFLNPTLVGDS